MRTSTAEYDYIGIKEAGREKPDQKMWSGFLDSHDSCCRGNRIAEGTETVMCCVEDLARKDVINVKDGCRLGFVGDVEIDVCDGKILSLIVYGRVKFFGLFGREDDLVIPWCDIQKIGEDIILVCCEPACRPVPKRKGLFERFH